MLEEFDIMHVLDYGVVMRLNQAGIWPMDHSEKLKADYIKQFEYVLPRTVEALISTFFWPSSPSSGGCFDNPVTIEIPITGMA